MKKGLLYIPDISGFTNFVNSVEIEHSKHIIQELLELLLDANNTDLQVSEIEGDAILFYQFGDVVNPEQIYAQVKQMYTRFHEHLKRYESLRTCHCNACSSVINLTLKVITHFGEFTTYKVNGQEKLFGKDVIIVHRLLKNEIDSHEYWLVTNNSVSNLINTVKWEKGIKETEAGIIDFYYTLLADHKP